ncbi:hypothetical protein [Rhizobium laguerreae]|uniref:hypothetical protein n=1 Tax=Rhizobium laguerreae TaxID=1076926 RepID=UPI001FE5FE29|nr:hypothetical protein [Rhizobium laguerreae]
MEAIARFQAFDTHAGIRLRLTDLDCPSKQRTDGFYDVVGGAWAVDPRIADGRDMLSLQELKRLVAMLHANFFENTPPAAHSINRDRVRRSLKMLMAEPTEGPRYNKLCRIGNDGRVAVRYALFGALIFAQKRGSARLLTKPDLLLAFDAIVQPDIAVPVCVLDDAL